jgi:hypothetical protein
MFTGYQTILPTDFTDEINSVGNSVGKIITSSFFFLLCFNYFVSHCNSLSIYQENIAIGKIHRKFTDENIPSIFPFVLSILWQCPLYYCI